MCIKCTQPIIFLLLAGRNNPQFVHLRPSQLLIPHPWLSPPPAVNFPTLSAMKPWRSDCSRARTRFYRDRAACIPKPWETRESRQQDNGSAPRGPAGPLQPTALYSIIKIAG